MKNWLYSLFLLHCFSIFITAQSIPNSNKILETDLIKIKRNLDFQSDPLFLESLLSAFNHVFFQSPNLLDTSLSIKLKEVSLSLNDNWEKALSFYKEGRKEEAINLLDHIIQQKYDYYKYDQISILFEQAYILLIDCYLSTDNLNQAQQIIKNIQREINFELNEFVDLQKSKIDILNGKNFKASLKLVQSLKQTLSPYIYSSSKKLLLEIIQKKGLSTNELQNLIDQLYFNSKLMNNALLSLAEQQKKEQKYQSAQISYQTWLSLFPKDPSQKGVKKKLNQVLNKQDVNNTIILMLPLSQIGKELGITIFKGIKLRLEQEKHSPLIKLIDTKNDPIHAIQTLRKELHRSNIIGIIGPTISSVATAVAIELSGSDIPIITPTANKRNLTSLSHNVFQINTTSKVFEESIANYAINCLNIKKFAILAPNNYYGQSVSESFQKILEQKNISLIANEYYNPNKNNYSEPIQSLKGTIAQDLIQHEINSKNIFYLSDPLKKHVQRWIQDSTIQIEGLLIIANDGKTAVNIYSQLQYHKIKTTVLGFSEWNTQQSKLSKLNKGRANPIFFSTDFYKYKQDSNWISFSNLFYNRWKTYPNKISTLAYDATEFLLLAQKSTSQKTLKSLQNIKEFKGVRGLLKMDPQSHSQSSSIVLNWSASTLKPAPTCDTP